MTIWDAPVAAGTDRRLILAGRLPVVNRDLQTVQIGLDSSRRILIRNAPAGTAELLSSLDGRLSVGEVTHRLAARYRVRADTWDVVIDQLVDAGFLWNGPAETGNADGTTAGAHPDRRSLASRTDVQRAGLVMTKRQESVAVVVGTGRVAGSVATLLAAAGVGHVHLAPDRPLRPTDVAPAGLATEQFDALRRPERSAVVADRNNLVPRPRGRSARLRSADRLGQPQRADHEALAAMIRRVSPAASVHSPAGQLPPDIVVLASDGPVDQVQLRRLSADRTAHLAVRVGELRGVVGPLVLPGRSSCINCHDLHRRDRDPGWPQVLMALQHAVAVPPAVLATAVAATTAEQVLQHLDGLRTPDAVDGTLELVSGEWVVRRRSWQPHPSCFCQYG